MEVNCTMYSNEYEYEYKNCLYAQRREEFTEDLHMLAKTWFALPESILT